ncbi:MAG: hypothetical protein RI580_09570 [Halothece sp. Uz-M2-17]|nr:hypothetical protein [Halothece sp. Uz-M2-17]
MLTLSKYSLHNSNSTEAPMMSLNTTQELKEIQARIAALVRGLQTQPDNVADYTEALEVQLLKLNEIIENLPE